jgi:aspartate 1-decarboxylase
MCRAKIHRATVTECCLDYEGSLELDEALIEAAGLLPNEMIQVLNLSNGQRFETYVIKAKRGSGKVSFNGAAARMGEPGDKVIVLSTAWLPEEEARHLSPIIVRVDSRNRIVKG